MPCVSTSRAYRMAVYSRGNGRATARQPKKRIFHSVGVEQSHKAKEGTDNEEAAG